MAPSAAAELKVPEPPAPSPDPELGPRRGIRAVLFGPPGSGKGTQVRAISLHPIVK